uniref:MARVEL domain-containing protein n=1 Tax=Meloidogyne hapla TaxID=6305 RepID=A0A1I8BNL0_MELHA
MSNHHCEKPKGRQQRLFNGISYNAPPSAPSLEININQHNPSPCQSSCDGYTPTPISSPIIKSIRRPPYEPPPPPPSAPFLENEYETPEYLINENNKKRRESWRQLGRNASIRAVRAGEAISNKFNNEMNGTIFKLSLCELLFSTILLSLGILCFCKTKEYCPYYSAIWTSFIFILNSIIGLIASKTNYVDHYIAHLILSLISIVLCSVGGIISLINWQLIGTYKQNNERGRQLINPKADEEQMYRAFCLLGEHDARRISYIYSHMNEYNFRECLIGVKIGVAVNSLQFLITIVLGKESF